MNNKLYKMKSIKLWFFLLFLTSLHAQDKSAKKEILKLCIYMAESVKENHLIDNKYQFFVKSNNLFSDVEGLNIFGNPVVFFSSNKKINSSHLDFMSLDFENPKSAKATFSYNCEKCPSWNYEIDFQFKESWTIVKTKTDIKK